MRRQGAHAGVLRADGPERRRSRTRPRLLRLVWTRGRRIGARTWRARPHRGVGAREIAVAYAMMLTSSVATLAMSEAALRAFAYGSQRPAPPARLMDDAQTTLLDCYPSNPRGYFDVDLRDPATRKQHKLLAAARRFDAVARRAPHAVEFRYNALRFRDRPLGPRPRGVRRVVVIGDSFTEGQGVKEGDTYARVLERTLNRPGTASWEVRNCGRRGADFPELYETFSAVRPYGADVVVYGMVLNDAAQSPAFRSRQGYLNDWMMLRGRVAAGGEEPLAWHDSRLWAFVRDRWDSRRVSIESRRSYRDMYAEPNHEGWKQTSFFLSTMHAQTAAGGGRFVVALWPWLVDLDRGYPFEEAHLTIRRFCEGAGIAFYDLRTVLRQKPAEALWVHPVDWHPNEVAHRIVGQALAPVVTRGLPLAVE